MSRSPSKKIKNVVYGLMTGEEIQRISVVNVFEPYTNGEDDKLENTAKDPRMGIDRQGKICETCHRNWKDCTGHFGHIELPMPIYHHKNLIPLTVDLLNIFCPKCAGLRRSYTELVMSGLVPPTTKDFDANKESIKNLADSLSTEIGQCPNPECGSRLPEFSKQDNPKDIKYHYSKDGTSMPFPAEEALSLFQRISNEDLRHIGFNNSLMPLPKNYEFSSLTREHPHQFRPESLILTHLPVLPIVSRPSVEMDGEINDDDLTKKYNDIVKIRKKILDNGKGQRMNRSRKPKTVEQFKEELKNTVWSLIDDKDAPDLAKTEYKSIMGRQTTKSGRIQKYIAGKRVNFTARSVIDSGPGLRADQVGVPRYIAEKTSVPITVTSENYDDCVKLVREGKVLCVWQRGRGRQNIKRLPDEKRLSFDDFGVGDKIHRFLQDDDIVLFNRQPTLRADGSILALRVKVIDQYAYSVPLCIVTPFNADKPNQEVVVR